VIRRPSAAIVLVALLTVGCHATKGAAVPSLEKAADIAVNHVANPASPNQPLVLFMLPQPLPAGTIVDTNRPPSTDTGHPGAEPSNLIHEIETETWLLWTDDPIEDSTRIVLIDRATGGVSTAGSDQWPLVDGEIPWVATASYWAPQARVFENLLPPTTRRPCGGGFDKRLRTRRCTREAIRVQPGSSRRGSRPPVHRHRSLRYLAR